MILKAINDNTNSFINFMAISFDFDTYFRVVSEIVICHSGKENKNPNKEGLGFRRQMETEL